MKNRFSNINKNKIIIIALSIFILIGYIIIIKNNIYFSRISSRECDIYRITGYYCWSCGGTRAFDNLIRLKYATALRYNLYMTLFMSIAGIYVLYLSIKYILTNKIKLLSKKVGWTIFIIAFILLFAFTIWRNSLFYPQYFLV